MSELDTIEEFPSSPRVIPVYEPRPCAGCAAKDAALAELVKLIQKDRWAGVNVPEVRIDPPYTQCPCNPARGGSGVCNCSRGGSVVWTS